MDTLSRSIREHEHKLHLLEAPDVQRRDLTNWLLVQLALDGPVRVLVGGNRYPGYAIHRLARRCTSQLGQVLGHIQVARAFTCYQMLALLQQSCAATPSAPVVILDLLDSFSDQNVPAWERARLLHACAERLQRLAERAPLLISLRFPFSPEAAVWVSLLERAADCIWQLDPGPDPTVVVRAAAPDPAAHPVVERPRANAAAHQLRLFD